MSCCGSAVASVPLTPHHRMQVRYGGGRSIDVTGPVTRTVYSFSGKERVQLVDPRDAVAIVRSGLFRMEGIVEVANDG